MSIMLTEADCSHCMHVHNDARSQSTHLLACEIKWCCMMMLKSTLTIANTHAANADRVASSGDNPHAGEV